MRALIEDVIAPSFDNPILAELGDSAFVEINGLKLAFTTDSFVVDPLFFPGGDIGSLAVNGTVNDLAVSGARPLYLSAGFILEEGFPTDELTRIVRSMQSAAAAAGVQIITGDTKVVDRNKGDGIYINTAGVGIIEHDQLISPKNVQPGDVIVINGDIGRHGIAIMAQREGLSFQTAIESDCAPLADLALDLIKNDVEIHCMRDLTRGGLATALVEIADVSQVNIQIKEKAILVDDAVQGACEILGLDPLYVANEGRFIAFISSSHAKKALHCLQKHPSGKDASIIGKTMPGEWSTVTLKTQIGTSRLITMLSGEQMPRIC